MSRKKTTDEFVQEFKEIFGEDEYFVTGEYVNRITPIEITHKCEYAFPRIPKFLLKKKKCICPKCFPKEGTTDTIAYVNDIFTTNKELYDLLHNKNDGHKFKENSKEKTYFDCPSCGKLLYKTIQVVNKQGLVCEKCSDGISYPEKFITEILNQLNIEYVREFSPEWIKPKFFDIQFNFNNQKYIIEVDGAFHFNNNKMNNTSKEETQLIDMYKQNIAKDHGYIVLRIDANYSNSSKRFEYLKNSLENSELKYLLNLTNIDYIKCNQVANKSIVVLIAQDWNNNVRDYDFLINKYKCSRNTVTRLLNRASESNLIKETKKEIREINIKNAHIKIANKRRNVGNKVLCNETKEVFNSYKEANTKYGANISRYFNHGYQFSGILSDGTKLTWTKLN
jgi:hypothetical protein